jgi:hypothetical protein
VSNGFGSAGGLIEGLIYDFVYNLHAREVVLSLIVFLRLIADLLLDSEQGSKGLLIVVVSAIQRHE